MPPSPLTTIRGATALASGLPVAVATGSQFRLLHSLETRKPMSDEPSPGRLPSLTSLRFLGALLVVWYHVTYVSGIFDGSLHTSLGTVFPFASGAVTFFFVLSGFVLTWAHKPGTRAVAFWRGRACRIFPNHVLSWTATLVFFAVTTTEVPMVSAPAHDAAAALTNLFLVQDWVPDADLYSGFNTPAWSLSCEVFFYALFPALIVAARRIPTERLRRVWTALAALIFLMPLVATAIPGPQLYDWMPVNERSMWFISAFPPVRLLEFLLGIATARLIQTGTWPRVSRLTVILAFVVYIGVLPALPPQYVMSTAMAPLIALAIARTALADIEGRSRQLARPVLVSLGETTFALYVVHFPLLLAVRHAIGPDPDLSAGAGFAIVFALIAVSVALSLVVLRFVELPLMRRWARSRRTPAPGRPASVSTTP
ncbi:4''-mycarosyl isovaleryl-CoA transferase [Streptomyces himastatinicus ATCC 53653]|uniref:4''-mycarosyl isovaleryl-CoA transferase n=2 Tax=Streptomyces TaxID=1883 RepID=D9WIU1_9ACTN|nr:4''-mycarosyl isovaleryl-CoA transferase [Streptomyces himastatinicus ATCC 53653]